MQYLGSEYSPSTSLVSSVEKQSDWKFEAFLKAWLKCDYERFLQDEKLVDIIITQNSYFKEKGPRFSNTR